MVACEANAFVSDEAHADKLAGSSRHLSAAAAGEHARPLRDELTNITTQRRGVGGMCHMVDKVEHVRGSSFVNVDVLFF